MILGEVDDHIKIDIFRSMNFKYIDQLIVN